MVSLASTAVGSPTGSLLREGLSGIAAGQQKAERAASSIVSAGIQQSIAVQANESPSTTTNFAEAAVDLLEAKNQVQASAAVIRTADEVLGTLIDTLA